MIGAGANTIRLSPRDTPDPGPDYSWSLLPDREDDSRPPPASHRDNGPRYDGAGRTLAPRLAEEAAPLLPFFASVARSPARSDCDPRNPDTIPCLSNRGTTMISQHHTPQREPRRPLRILQVNVGKNGQSHDCALALANDHSQISSSSRNPIHSSRKTAASPRHTPPLTPSPQPTAGRIEIPDHVS